MSAPWRNTSITTLALSPEGIAFSSQGKTQRISTQACPSTQSLLAELTASTETHKLGKVKLILSNHYVRYAVLPWQPNLVSAEDWQAIAEHHMRKIHGNIAESWQIRVSMPEFGASTLACAMDSSLLASLHDIAQQSGWQIVGIEPALMRVFNHYLQQLGDNHWLFVAEPQRLLLGEITDGQWRQCSIASPLAGEERNAGHDLLLRAGLHAGSIHAQVACFGTASLMPNPVDGLLLHRLPLPAQSPAATTLEMLAGLS